MTLDKIVTQAFDCVEIFGRLSANTKFDTILLMVSPKQESNAAPEHFVVRLPHYMFLESMSCHVGKKGHACWRKLNDANPTKNDRATKLSYVWMGKDSGPYSIGIKTS